MVVGRKDTYCARLEGYANEKLPCAARDVVPLILSAHVVEVRGELDPTHKDVISHIILPFRTPLGLFRAEVGLD